MEQFELLIPASKNPKIVKQKRANIQKKFGISLTNLRNRFLALANPRLVENDDGTTTF
jgi:hypothetical protein